MKVILAENAGFCYGVKRAIKITSNHLDQTNNNTYSYGPLIHNSQEVKRLEGLGLKTIDSFDVIDKGSVIIRSHGIPKDKEEEMSKLKFDVIDTTCPYVKAIHKRVEKYKKLGYNIVIIGSPTHPEVIGINGYCDNEAYVVESLDEVKDLPDLGKLCIVSQTTNTIEKFERISKALEAKADEVLIFNTICKATKTRQESTYELSKIVDAMIVIGGYNSSNTKKLYEISKENCKNVFHIESIKDLSLQDLKNYNIIGITAGASTPDWIIKEAITTMDNLNNNEMMEAIENSFRRVSRGEIVTGEIIFVTANELMVNINYKSDGIINKEELDIEPDLNLKDVYKEGEEIEVYIVKVDDGEGNVVLSTKRVAEVKAWGHLEESFNLGEILDAKVIRVVKGGLIAEVKGIHGFIPASHVSSTYVSELDQFKDREFKVKIIDFNQGKRRIVLSRKLVEMEEIKELEEKVWGSLEVGKVVRGTVQRLTDFGAFVDLGGVDGLIHISDLAWNRVKHPSEVVKANEEVDVQILSFDREKNRISLGLKQTVEEPWELFKNNANIGDVVEGKVVNILDFGAFIRLEHGVDGLLHVSQISNQHIDKPSDVLENGESVTVKIIDINEDDRRISLSIKELIKKEIEETQVKEEEVKEEEVLNSEEEEITIGDILNNK